MLMATSRLRVMTRNEVFVWAWFCHQAVEFDTSMSLEAHIESCYALVYERENHPMPAEGSLAMSASHIFPCGMD